MLNGKEYKSILQWVTDNRLGQMLSLKVTKTTVSEHKIWTLRRGGKTFKGGNLSAKNK